MLKIKDLIIMQESVRNTDQLTAMIEFVKNGGFFTKENLIAFAKEHNIRPSPLMEIAIVSSSHEIYKMIHDGTHRNLAIFIGGRDYLRDDEYVVKHWKNEDYRNINFKNKWVTPFDPRTHVRAPDIYAFKHKVLSMSESEATEFIKNNSHQYILPRTIFSVEELANKYEKLS